MELDAKNQKNLMSENMRTFVTDGLTEGAGFTRASPNKISIGDVSFFTKSFVPRSVNFPSPTIMFLLLTKMDEGDMSYNILLKDFPGLGGGHFPDFARELYAPRGILFY